VAGFIGGHNIFEGEFEALAEGHRLTVEGARAGKCCALTNLHGSGIYGFSVRADRVRLAGEGRDDTDVTLPASIAMAEYQGTHVVLHCETESGRTVQVCEPDDRYFADTPAPGDRVTLGWDCADMNVFPSQGGKGDNQ